MSTLKAKDRRPTHPGAILREDVLPSLGITQTELAVRLGVSRRKSLDFWELERKNAPSYEQIQKVA